MLFALYDGLGPPSPPNQNIYLAESFRQILAVGLDAHTVALTCRQAASRAERERGEGGLVSSARGGNGGGGAKV